MLRSTLEPLLRPSPPLDQFGSFSPPAQEGLQEISGPHPPSWRTHLPFPVVIVPIDIPDTTFSGLGNHLIFLFQPEFFGQERSGTAEKDKSHHPSHSALRSAVRRASVITECLRLAIN